ncbi:uncharacterized protein LOC135844040 [Planococcus citri]|uniref:uncharacterized protein LOC135844040 n=1 Tax=Planococcus citri TaxID=170843 RepID=UPI0031F7F7B3
MVVECTWSGCTSSFGKKSSLKRHIKAVHEKRRAFVCPVAECEAAFNDKYGLKRHEASVHLKERNFKCCCCPQLCANRTSLRRHEQNKHGVHSEPDGKIVKWEKPSLICAECGNTFTRKDRIARHIVEQHGFDGEYFKCQHCSRKFKRKNDIRKHMITKHLQPQNRVPARKPGVRCILCERSFELMNQLCDHYVDEHKIDLNIKTLSFSSRQEFLAWKKEIEDSTMARYRLRNYTKRKQGFICHRSGCYNVKSADRKRSFLRRGSKKLNGMCPASVTLQMNEKNATYVVTFIQTHVGHSPSEEELKFIFLRKEERKEVAQLLAAGVPRQSILKDQQYRNVHGDLLDYKKLYNLGRFFKEERSEDLTDPYENDPGNLETFLAEHQASILFHKRQGDSPPVDKFTDCQLTDEDAILVFMNDFQEKMLKTLGRNILCLDGTLGTNSCGFFLYTLLVLDYDGEGFPVAFMFSNRNDKISIKVFLRSIKEKICEVITPKIVMSDMQELYYNAWVEEMIKPATYLHCMWYVWKEWKKHFPASNKTIKQDLYDLTLESCLETFHERLEKFLTLGVVPEGNVDQRVNDFFRYFEKEFCNDKQYMCWSYAYRLHSGESTATHLECFHRTLDYLHSFGKTTKDLYSGLRLIVYYLNQRINTIFGKSKGKSVPRLVFLKQAHRLVEKKGCITIQKAPEGWLVPSFQEPKDGCEEFYLVQKIRESCPAIVDKHIGVCYLNCAQCNECAHRYSCTCVENSIRLHMCKHIHTVALAELESQSLMQDESYKLQEVSAEDFSTLTAISPEEGSYVLHEEVIDLDATKRNLMDTVKSLLEKVKTREHVEVVEELLKSANTAIDSSRAQQATATFVQR